MNDAAALEQKFAARVDTSGGPDACHPWTGGRRDSSGYGLFYIGNRTTVYAHRWLMSQELGRELDRTEEILHSCDNPPCVNRAHLRVGSHAENMRDMAERKRQRGWKSDNTHCPQGHPYSGENVRVGPDGARDCRACNRAKLERQRRARGVPAKDPNRCAHGHEYTPENTYYRPSGGRKCRTCTRTQARSSWARKKAIRG